MKISPDGLYESDIVLSQEQAYKLFSKYISPITANHRKVAKDAVFRWPLPIHYHFDGTHSIIFLNRFFIC